MDTELGCEYLVDRKSGTMCGATPTVPMLVGATVENSDALPQGIQITTHSRMLCAEHRALLEREPTDEA